MPDFSGNLGRLNATGPLASTQAHVMRIEDSNPSSSDNVFFGDVKHGDHVFQFKWRDGEVYEPKLSAFRRQTGFGKDPFVLVKEWEAPADGGTSSGPLLSQDGTLIVTNGAGNGNGSGNRLFAFDAASGKLIYTFDAAKFRDMQLDCLIDKANRVYLVYRTCRDSNPGTETVWITSFSPDTAGGGVVRGASTEVKYNDNYCSDTGSHQNVHFVRMDLVSPTGSSMGSAGPCERLLIWSKPSRIVDYPWIRAFDATTLSLCWEYKLPTSESTVSSLLVDEEASTLYFTGSWTSAQDNELLCFWVSSSGLTLASRYPVQPLYGQSAQLTLQVSTSSLLCAEQDYVVVYNRCSALSSGLPCSLKPQRKLAANNGNVAFVTNTAVYIADSSWVQGWDVATGKILFAYTTPTYPPPNDFSHYNFASLMFSDKALIGTFDSLSSGNIVILTEVPPEPEEDPAQRTQRILVGVNYGLAGLAFAIGAYLKFCSKSSSRDDIELEGLGEGLLGRSTKIVRNRCCDEARKHTTIMVLKSASLIIQVYVNVVAIIALHNTQSNTEAVTKPLAIDSIDTFRSQYVQNCSLPTGRPLPSLSNFTDFCFCSDSGFGTSQCPPSACGRGTSKCSDVALNLCACDASFYPFKCGDSAGTCDYSLPDCSSTPFKFDRSTALPSLTNSFDDCTYHYQEATNYLQTTITLHVIVVAVSLAASNTSCLTIPIGIGQFIAAMVGISLLAHVKGTSDLTDGQLPCTGIGGLLSGALSGCVWSEQKEGVDFIFLEQNALDAIGVAKSAVAALNNFGVGGAIFGFLGLFQCCKN